jgi:hypothetical protein
MSSVWPTWTSVTHDITIDPLEIASFDLIHSRAVLGHLPSKDATKCVERPRPVSIIQGAACAPEHPTRQGVAWPFSGHFARQIDGSACVAFLAYGPAVAGRPDAYRRQGPAEGVPQRASRWSWRWASAGTGTASKD